jgi:hypothetical protein
MYVLALQMTPSQHDAWGATCKQRAQLLQLPATRLFPSSMLSSSSLVCLFALLQVVAYVIDV